MVRSNLTYILFTYMKSLLNILVIFILIFTASCNKETKSGLFGGNDAAHVSNGNVVEDPVRTNSHSSKAKKVSAYNMDYNDDRIEIKDKRRAGQMRKLQKKNEKAQKRTEKAKARAAK